jgi:dTMP kinase
MDALFVTLEGGEGAGKSSQMRRIAEWLEQHGHRVVTTREPGGTVLSEILRDLVLHGDHPEMSPMTELLLVFAARAQHVDEVIRPALEQGQTVLCDRFTDASFAYQGGGRGLPVEDIRLLESLVQGKLRPDLTLLLDVPVEVGLARTRGRDSEDRFETETAVFLDKVRQAYLERANAERERIAVIDASVGEPAVWDAIRAILEQRCR